MALVVADVGIEADAAGIMVVGGVVEPEGLGQAEWAVPGVGRSGHASGLLTSILAWRSSKRPKAKAILNGFSELFVQWAAGLSNFGRRRRRGRQ